MNKRTKESVQNTTNITVVLFVLMFIVAWGLRLLPINDIPLQFFAALVAAAITVVITDLLLKSQTKSEFNKQKQEKVYEEKLHIFQNYLRLVCDISLGRSINEKQQIELQYLISLIAMHMDPDNLKDVIRSTGQLLNTRCQIDEIDNGSTSNWLMSIVQCFRKELYGKDIPIPIEEGNDFFTSMISNATLYNEFPKIGCLPSGYTVKQDTNTFHWNSEIEKWVAKGWKKDDENKNADYLRFYLGDKENPTSYVEVRYEIIYQHYILRVFCKDNQNVAKNLVTQFGGFRNRNTWWRVLDSPFYEMHRCELISDFDSTHTLKESLYPWFDIAFFTIEKQKENSEEGY